MPKVILTGKIDRATMLPGEPLLGSLRSKLECWDDREIDMEIAGVKHGDNITLRGLGRILFSAAIDYPNEDESTFDGKQKKLVLCCMRTVVCTINHVRREEVEEWNTCTFILDFENMTFTLQREDSLVEISRIDFEEASPDNNIGRSIHVWYKTGDVAMVHADSFGVPRLGGGSADHTSTPDTPEYTEMRETALKIGRTFQAWLNGGEI